MGFASDGVNYYFSYFNPLILNNELCPSSENWLSARAAEKINTPSEVTMTGDARHSESNRETIGY